MTARDTYSRGKVKQLQTEFDLGGLTVPGRALGTAHPAFLSEDGKAVLGTRF